MDYSLLGEVCALVADRDYYHNRGIFLFHNSIVPSIREKKFFILRRDGKLIGFCNFAFLTREEIDEATYDGDEVFCRDDGKILHFCTLVCESGPKDVLKFTRYIQASIYLDFVNLNFFEVRARGQAAMVVEQEMLAALLVLLKLAAVVLIVLLRVFQVDLVFRALPKVVKVKAADI